MNNVEVLTSLHRVRSELERHTTADFDVFVDLYKVIARFTVLVRKELPEGVSTMTRSEVLALQYRDVLHHVSKKNADGTPMRCRVNGKCKTWKTRSDFRLPVKHGLKTCFYIDQDNAHEWIAE